MFRRKGAKIPKKKQNQTKVTNNKMRNTQRESKSYKSLRHILIDKSNQTKHENQQQQSSGKYIGIRTVC